MFRALVTCPDDDCAEAFDAVAELAQLEALICDCGCALEIVGWPDVEAEPLAQVIMLRVGSGRLAA